MAKKPPGLAVRRGRRLQEAALRRFKQIYLKSFSPSERVDFRKLLGRIAEGKEWLFGAWSEGELLGFAVTIPLPGTDAHFLDYLAVAPQFRNHGIGSTLLGAIRRQLRAAGNASGIILEVKPDDHPRETENALRKRRIEFYRRNGARLVECAPHYRAPNLAGKGAVGYRLMWLPLSDGGQPPCGALLRRLIRSIFIQGYGRTDDDVLLRAVLKGVLRRRPQSERVKQ